MGTAFHIDMHIWVEGNQTVTRGHRIAHEVKDKLFRNFPQVIDVHIHVEPYEYKSRLPNNASAELRILPVRGPGKRSFGPKCNNGKEDIQCHVYLNF